MKAFSTGATTRIRSVLVIGFWLVVWQLLYLAVGKEVIIPSPIDTFQTLAQLATTAEFYFNTAATMQRVVAGIVISFVAGLATAVLAYYSRIVRDLLGLIVNILKATPVMAVIIFALLWLSSGNVPVFVCLLMCYPVVYTNILSGLDSMDIQYIEMSKIYKIRKMDVIKDIYLPFVKPHIKSALSLTTGLSWKTVVAAEVLSSPNFSMGYNLLNAKIYLETESLFAWIIAIVGLSILFEKLVNILIGTNRQVVRS
jgi:NitT/TauT family transport system permease protein